MKVVKLGEELLRKKAEPVLLEEINDDLRAFIDEMFDVMIELDGVGFAGPQAGVSKRFFIALADDDVRRVFINPQIISTSQELCDFEEGCLSIPKTYESITRPAKVTVQAFNEKGKPFTLEAEGLLARVIQHENDHLDGILFIDRGDKEFAEKTERQFKRRVEKEQQKQREKEKKERKIADKKALQEAKRHKNNRTAIDSIYSQEV